MRNPASNFVRQIHSIQSARPLRSLLQITTSGPALRPMCAAFLPRTSQGPAAPSAEPSDGTAHAACQSLASVSYLPVLPDAAVGVEGEEVLHAASTLVQPPESARVQVANLEVRDARAKGIVGLLLVAVHVPAEVESRRQCECVPAVELPLRLPDYKFHVFEAVCPSSLPTPPPPSPHPPPSTPLTHDDGLYTRFPIHTLDET